MCFFYFYLLKRENINKHNTTTPQHTPEPIQAISGSKKLAIIAPMKTTAPANAKLDNKHNIVSFALDDLECDLAKESLSL